MVHRDSISIRKRPFAWLLFACVLATPAHAGQTTCRLQYEASGGGYFVKRTAGSGTIRCDNGQSFDVDIVSRGGGLTFGHTEIANGHGEFTPVADIHDLLGAWTEAEVSAGSGRRAGKSQIMKKGPIRLKLTGKGSGRSLGLAFGRFHILQRDDAVDAGEAAEATDDAP